MRIATSHRIDYHFDATVFVEPHTVRMRPRTDLRQRLLSYELAIFPDPAGRSENIDIAGGSSELVWFDGMFSTLSFSAESVVETALVNPFDFILPKQEMNTLPLALSLLERIELAPFMVTGNYGSAVATLIAEGRHAVKDDTIGYPTWLATQIANRIEHQERTDDGLLDLEHLLRTEKGACRDKAALFITGCRAVGFPARFVSGYQFAETESGRHELHGWAEIYFPGGGWRGYDPSLGVACQDDHLTLCAASQIELTNPIIGSTRGDSIGEITYTVTVSAQ